MREVLGDALAFLAKIGLRTCLVGAMAADVILMLSYLEFSWIAAGFLLFPVTVVVFPFYAAAALGNWLPLWFTYLGPVIFGVTLAIGHGIRKAAS